MYPHPSCVRLHVVYMSATGACVYNKTRVCVMVLRPAQQGCCSAAAAGYSPLARALQQSTSLHDSRCVRGYGWTRCFHHPAVSVCMFMFHVHVGPWTLLSLFWVQWLRLQAGPDPPLCEVVCGMLTTVDSSCSSECCTPSGSVVHIQLL